MTAMSAGNDAEIANANNVPRSDDASHLDVVLRSVIEHTQRTLGILIQTPALSTKLLARPPVRFIRDIFLSLRVQNKYFGYGLFTIKELKYDIRTQVGQLTFLVGLITFVTTCTENDILRRRIKVLNIVSGNDPVTTNLFLHDICAAFRPENSARWGHAVQRGIYKKEASLLKQKAIEYKSACEKVNDAVMANGLPFEFLPRIANLAPTAQCVYKWATGVIRSMATNPSQEGIQTKSAQKMLTSLHDMLINMDPAVVEHLRELIMLLENTGATDNIILQFVFLQIVPQQGGDGSNNMITDQEQLFPPDFEPPVTGKELTDGTDDNIPSQRPSEPRFHTPIVSAEGEYFMQRSKEAEIFVRQGISDLGILKEASSGYQDDFDRAMDLLQNQKLDSVTRTAVRLFIVRAEAVFAARKAAERVATKQGGEKKVEVEKTLEQKKMEEEKERKVEKEKEMERECPRKSRTEDSDDRSSKSPKKSINAGDEFEKPKTSKKKSEKLLAELADNTTCTSPLMRGSTNVLRISKVEKDKTSQSHHTQSCGTDAFTNLKRQETMVGKVAKKKFDITLADTGTRVEESANRELYDSNLGDNPLYDIFFMGGEPVKRIDMNSLIRFFAKPPERKIMWDRSLYELEQCPSPLMFAAVISRQVEVVHFLLKHNANIDWRSFSEPWEGIDANTTILESVQKQRIIAADKEKDEGGLKPSQDGSEAFDARTFLMMEQMIKLEEDRLRGWDMGRQLLRDTPKGQKDAVRTKCSGVSTHEEIMDELLAIETVRLRIRKKMGFSGMCKAYPLEDPLIIDDKKVDAFAYRKRLYNGRAAFVHEHMRGSPDELYVMSEDTLGGGSFGFVQKVKHLCTNLTRAVKTIPKLLLEDCGLWQELYIMRRLDHPRVMRLYCTFEDSSKIYIVSELCTGGELFDAIIKKGSFEESVCVNLSRQMLSAVCYLHNASICHRDLKPENFLFTEPCEDDLSNASIKMIDFGTAKDFNENQLKTKVCTLHYVAPEILSRADRPYTQACDIWSLGVIIYLMHSGYLPFSAESDGEVLRMIRKGTFDYEPAEAWANTSEMAIDLINKMLVTAAQQRYTASQVAGHPWFLTAKVEPKYSTQIKVDDELITLMPSNICANFVHYFASNFLRRCTIQIVAHHLSDNEVADLRDLFICLDTNLLGEIPTVVLEKSFLHSDVPQEFQKALKKIMKQLKSTMATINYTLFLAMCMDKKLYCNKKALLSAFFQLDTKQDGHIDLEEIILFLDGKFPEVPEDYSSLRDWGNIIFQEVNKKDPKNKKIDIDDFVQHIKGGGQ